MSWSLFKFDFYEFPNFQFCLLQFGKATMVALGTKKKKKKVKKKKVVQLVYRQVNEKCVARLM